MPDSARDVIMRRVERLGDETGDLLTVAAVIGRSFDLELLERLTDRGGELLDRLETAVDASLLDESAERIGRFRFVHSLINQALYETLGATRRSSMHHRVVVALEELYGQEPADHVAELALHWRLAAVDGRKAGRYSAQAGRRALDSLAPDEAANLFTDALDMLGPDEDAERCRTLIGLGEAQQLIGDAAYRTTLLDAARIASSLGDADLAADAALANTRGSTASSATSTTSGSMQSAAHSSSTTAPTPVGAPNCSGCSRRSCSTSTTARGGRRSPWKPSPWHGKSTTQESGHACCSTRSTGCGAPT